MKLLRILPIVIVSALVAMPVPAQVSALAANKAPAAPSAALADPLNRTTPRDAVSSFLHACSRNDYARAANYLDLRAIPSQKRVAEGMQLALQLEEVLNKDTNFDIESLSQSPEGDRHDSLKADLERVDSFNVAGRTIDVDLQQVELKPGERVWLFAQATVAAIPTLSTLLGESDFEKHLPDVLVKAKFMETSLWRWLALILMIPALGFIARLLSRVGLAVAKRFVRKKTGLSEYGLTTLLGPVALLLGVAAYGAGLSLVGPSALIRFYISRLLTLLGFMAIAWIVMRLVDIVMRRLHFASDPRQQALFSSVLPLAVRVAKVVIFSIAILSTLSAWGYSTNTIWATLGVGSLAVALAAQKTLENFFGGVSVIGDRPVLVGDFCRVGSQVGTVEDIGLRSTRIRTLERTLLTVPNSQFSTMTLENFAKRDKMWFHPTITLRCDATSAQIRQVMESFKKILQDHPNVEIGGYPVRFTGIGDYTYNIEIFAYVLTPNSDEFLQAQSELLIRLIEAVEAAGTGIAVPLRELTGALKTSDQLDNRLPPPAIPTGNRDGAAKS
jgi:MscS family membrane protein